MIEIFIHEHIHGEEIFPYRLFIKIKKKTRLPPKQRFPSIRVSRSNWATESVGPNGAYLSWAAQRAGAKQLHRAISTLDVAQHRVPAPT
jgi:hypothetical protein